MNRTPVSSSQIKSVGFDGASRVLEIEFSDGSVFAYDGVQPHVYEALIDAESVGKTFHQIVKGRYEHRKI